MDKEYIKIRESYDNNVENYAKNGGILLSDNLNSFISLVKHGGRILDIGSGVGQDVEFFYKKGYEVIGVDFSSKMINYSKRIREGGIFKKVNLFDLNKEYSKNSFDGIWISSVITHLKFTDISKALKIVRNLLKTNGVLGIIVKRRKTKEIKKGKGGIIFNEFYKKDIKHYFKTNKIKIIKVSDFKAHDKDWIFILATKNSE